MSTSTSFAIAIDPASATTTITAWATALLMTFAAAPAPSAPKRICLTAMASSTGLASSIAASSPPRSSVAVPAAIWLTPARIEASISRAEVPSSAFASARTSSGFTVLVSITTAPSASCGAMAASTAREAAGVGRHRTTKRQPATSAGPVIGRAPNASAAAMRSGDRS